MKGTLVEDCPTAWIATWTYTERIQTIWDMPGDQVERSGNTAVFYDKVQGTWFLRDAVWSGYWDTTFYREELYAGMCCTLALYEGRNMPSNGEIRLDKLTDRL